MHKAAHSDAITRISENVGAAEVTASFLFHAMVLRFGEESFVGPVLQQIADEQSFFTRCAVCSVLLCYRQSAWRPEAAMITCQILAKAVADYAASCLREQGRAHDARSAARLRSRDCGFF